MKNKLTFDIQSYWHVGSGLEAGAYADALVLKNSYGLPYLPGKSIKGLIREAFKVADENQWFKSNVDSLEQLLFGNEEKSGINAQGLLQFSNAMLCKGETAYFVENIEHKKNLFKVISSTAIEPKSGVAKNSSLRNVEVSIPMTLHSHVEVNTNHPYYQKYSSELQEKLSFWLDSVLSLITEIGAKKHRGFGRAIVSLETVTGE